ncbi:MAG TPA: hypothetical protein VMI31_02010 [Fimbriimonadaceae bacterium]|nr:hypothetical protein [Fimbriimonadaceae bacterium]
MNSIEASEETRADSPRTFGSLAVLPSNVGAVETALHFASGLNAFTAIVGPSGWGKTHILECVSEKLSQRWRPVPLVMSATEWLAGGHSGDPSLPLLLDDVQELTSRPRSRIQLRLGLERRVRSGRPTMLAFTAAKKTRHLSAILPCAKDWMIGAVSEPAPSERMLIIAQLADAQGLSLSSSLTRVIAHKMRGNGRTLVGALRRLRLHGPLWNDVSGTLKACGLLEPFFADSGSWDLRGHVLSVARGFDASRFGVPISDLVAFTMLREAALSEVDVARSLSIEPGEAYARCARFERQYKTSENALFAVRCFAESVVEGLISD